MKLVRAFVLRPMLADPARTALTVLSVALGVAVVIAIELAGTAAAGSFRSSLETLVGKSDLVVTANGGVAEAWVARLAQVPRNLRLAAVIESPSMIGVAVTGLGAWQPREFRPGDPKIVDIAEAQHALGLYGRVDRIDIAVSPTEDFAAVEREIRALLPPAYALDRPGVRAEENLRMLEAFRRNLRALSYVSLLVGAFLIYNTIAISVVRRRHEIGILRALGATRGAVLAIFLGEAALLGLAGSGLGVPIGRLMAEVAVRLIGGTVESLYTSSRPAPVDLTPQAALAGLLAGILVALISAWAPSLEAMRVPPVSAMGRGAHEFTARLRWRRSLVIGAALALTAFAIANIAPYSSALVATAAAAFSTPALVLAASRLARSKLRAENLLGVRGLAASLPRTSVIVASLATAIAMMASVGSMVGSFRETVVVWLDAQLRADLYVRPSGGRNAGQFPPLPSNAPALARSVKGVEAVDVFHAIELRFAGRRAIFAGGDLDIVRRHGRLRFLPGQDRDAILRSTIGADRVVISEPFANKNGLHAGDRITLALGERMVAVEIAGVYYDYSTEMGFVISDRAQLLKYLPTQPATNIAIYLDPDADRAAARRELESKLQGMRVAINDNHALRSVAVAIFDRTFAITYALEAVAILVAMLGAANSLLALVLDRRREFGLLRYLGAEQRQIRRMVLVEAGMIGALSAALGLLLGVALSLLLVFVVNKQSFGWTIQFHPPIAMLAAALTAVWASTVAAAWHPARVAGKCNPIEVMHLE